jgi:hypothetical protein
MTDRLKESGLPNNYAVCVSTHKDMDDQELLFVRTAYNVDATQAVAKVQALADQRLADYATSIADDEAILASPEGYATPLHDTLVTDNRDTLLFVARRGYFMELYSLSPPGNPIGTCPRLHSDCRRSGCSLHIPQGVGKQRGATSCRWQWPAWVSNNTAFDTHTALQLFQVERLHLGHFKALLQVLLDDQLFWQLLDGGLLRLVLHLRVGLADRVLQELPEDFLALLLTARPQPIFEVGKHLGTDTLGARQHTAGFHVHVLAWVWALQRGERKRCPRKDRGYNAARSEAKAHS